jgi:hypothetical protein
MCLIRRIEAENSNLKAARTKRQVSACNNNNVQHYPLLIEQACGNCPRNWKPALSFWFLRIKIVQNCAKQPVWTKKQLFLTENNNRFAASSYDHVIILK